MEKKSSGDSGLQFGRKYTLLCIYILPFNNCIPDFTYLIQVPQEHKLIFYT